MNPLASRIKRISIAGFKSINKECSIEIRPLTLLAGANSSGKSSMIQPVLMLKQTLEAPYDPGAIALNGPNVQFTSAEQSAPQVLSKKGGANFSISLEDTAGERLSLLYSRIRKCQIFEIRKMQFISKEHKMTLYPEMNDREIRPQLFEYWRNQQLKVEGDNETKSEWIVIRDRCFLGLRLQMKKNGADYFDPSWISPADKFRQSINEIIHLPGLRANPKRTYPATGVGPFYQGVIQHYIASIIARWQKEGEVANLEKLHEDMEKLDLVWGIEARYIDGDQIEVLAGRLKKTSLPKININDMGIGVSQALPAAVALLAAEPGQMVYIDQPEITLHPRAQVAMATLLANAAKRGVRVVAETHSALLLKGVQTLVAEGKLDPSKVALHWFTRSEKDGMTRVDTAELDEAGRFGDWPEDFAETELKAESRYLDAAEKKLMEK